MLVRASVGAEWRFERVDGALLDYALFWEDCSYCDSDSPPPVKNRGTLYEDLILRVTYVGGRWVVGVLWGQGGFGHEVYVNGSLLYRKPPGYAGEPGVWGEYVGVALEVRLVSLGDSRADAAALFTAFDRVHEALACAAALGLDAGETNGLLRHLGVSGEVVRVRRGDGGAAFVFRNGSAVSVPLVLDVDVGWWGHFVLVNPCGAAVNWTLRLYVDNKTLGSRPGGRLAAEVPADMASYSVAPVYVFGVAEEAGLYRVSYRLYVRPGVYDVWGYRVVVDRERLAAANGSFVNWVWGFLESLAGRAAGDRCAEARGAGRRWAAERIGWAGVATEVDTALGGAALVFSAGTYGAGRTAARGAAEAVKVAEEVARGYKAARAVTYAYQLWQGVLLGWDVYLSVARGEVPVEALGAAVASVGGRVGERVRLVYSLATGGLLLMNLGHVPEMEELVRGIHGEASKYGEYAHCFVDGALGAFDAYAKEVLANQLVGVFSTFLDIDKVLNNKAYKGYLQLAGYSPFQPNHGPILPAEKFGRLAKGKSVFIVTNHKRFGVNEAGEPRVLYITFEKEERTPKEVKARPKLELVKEVGKVATVGGYDVVAYVYEGKDVMFGLHRGGRFVLGVYNDVGRMLMFAALTARDSDVRRGEVVLRTAVGDTKAEVYEFNIDASQLVKNIIDATKINFQPHTVYKDVVAAFLYGWGRVEINGVATEVPVVSKSDETWATAKLHRPVAESLGASEEVSVTVIKQIGGSRADILGVGRGGVILLGEVKSINEFKVEPELYPKKVDEVVSAITSRFKILESWGEASGEYVAFMSLAFSGVGSVGRTGSNAVGSAWATPVDLKTLTVPPPINKKPPLFVYSLFDPSDGRVMVWILEVPEGVFKGGKLDEKSLKSWLKEVHEEAYRRFIGEGGQINWDKEVELGVKLFERLREDRERYGDSGAVLDVVLDLFS